MSKELLAWRRRVQHAFGGGRSRLGAGRRGGRRHARRRRHRRRQMWVEVEAVGGRRPVRPELVAQPSHELDQIRRAGLQERLDLVGI